MAFKKNSTNVALAPQSYSKRRMRPHVKKKSKKPTKMAQMFWALDADTQQPVCFTTATASRTVAQATPQLLDIARVSSTHNRVRPW